MRKAAIICAAAALLIAACSKRHDTVTTTGTYTLDLPAKPDEYFSTKNGLPEEEAERLNNIATLGRVLFYDTRLSVNNATSCGSCHKQTIGFADDAKFSRGFEGRMTGRNSPGINGVAQSSFLFWDGRENRLTDLIMRPISNHVEMGIEDLNVLPAKLAEAEHYPALFTKAYGSAAISLEKISEAMSLFLSSIGAVSMGKPMFGGSTEGLTAEQLQGKALFDTKYDCGSCHQGGGNNGYGGGGSVGRMEDIGLDATYTDKGRAAITGLPTDMGRFKVPNLTNVALTAPYMHDGRYATLEEVIDHYSTGINTTPNLAPILRERLSEDPNTPARKMNISATEKRAIVAFLRTLNDNNANTDPKFSNPFKVK